MPAPARAAPCCRSPATTSARPPACRATTNGSPTRRRRPRGTSGSRPSGNDPMSITPGSRLGPYEITVAIGAGGMGEVYRARDTKLNRDVAIKVLPEVFALDPDRLTRFTREAQTLAALNHPNIAAIYGIA